MSTTLIVLIPTLLFAFMVIWGFVFGLIRGFRKSLILFIQSIVAFVLCLIFYFVMVNLSASDTLSVNIANTFMGQNGLQRMLGVSESNTTLTGILTEYISNQAGLDESIKTAIGETSPYIQAMVQYVYHIIWALVAWIIYFVLLFIFYLIYLIAYPERRHKKKVENKESLEKSGYKKHIWFGSLLGTFRGLVVGLLYMSFLGSALYIFGGGVGEAKYDYTVTPFGENNTLNEAYKYYAAVGEYGNHGIFKILNTIRDGNNVPYYLAISNIVLNGQYNDGTTSKTVYFTEEIGNYTKFVRQTFDLMVKIDPTVAGSLFDQNATPEEKNKIFEMFQNEEFQAGFENIINEFNEKSFFIDFGISFIDSLAQNVDDLTFLPDDVKEIIKIMFKRGYKSPNIPSDQTDEAPSVFSLETIINKNDVKQLVLAAVSILEAANVETMQEKIMIYIKGFVPALKGLSILGTEKKAEANKVFERLFTALTNLYLENTTETPEMITLEQVHLMAEESNVTDWCQEIINLLDTVLNMANLVESAGINFDDFTGENMYTNIINTMFKIFDTTDQKYAENIASYNAIETSLKSSKIVDKVLSTSIAHNFLNDFITGIYPTAYLERNIDYAGENGETASLLNSVRAILSNQENKQLINDLMTGLNDENVVSKLRDVFTNISVKDTTTNKSVLDYMMDSKILTSMLSAVILSKKDISQDIQLYIPNSAFLVVDGTRVDMIKKSELTELVDKVGTLLDIVVDYTDSTSPYYQSLDKVIERVDMSLLESSIIEGSLSNIIKKFASDSEAIVIPSNLSETENWLASGTGETKKLLTAIKNSAISIDSIINSSSGDQTDVFTNILNNLKTNYATNGHDLLESIYESEILVSTISTLLDSTIKPQITEEQANATKTKVFSALNETYYSYAEFEAIIDNVIDLDIDVANFDNISSLLSKITAQSSIYTGETKLDTIYRSTIFKSIIYDKLNDLITSPDSVLKSDARAFMNETINTINLSFVKKGELENIVDFINSLGASFDIESFDNVSQVTLSSDSIDALTSSYLLNATVSDKLITIAQGSNPTILIPTSSYDSTYSVVKAEKVGELLYALKDGLGLTSLANIESLNIVIPTTAASINALTDSDILRATITSKFDVNGDTAYVEANDNYVLSTTDYLNNTIKVLTQSELVNLINGLNVFTDGTPHNLEDSYTINENKLTQLTTQEIELVIESSILRCVVSDILYQYETAYNTSFPADQVHAQEVTVRALSASGADATMHVYTSASDYEKIIDKLSYIM